jgi:hypothetical protein
MAISDDLSVNCSNYAAQSRELRSVFAEAEVIKLAAVHGHTHGESAAARSSASAFIDSVASSTGRKAVFLQGSAADARNGREFTRVHYWGKDWNVGPRQVEKGDNDLTAMVDVDYHVDMRNHLARSFRPLIMYTVQPTRASVDRGEYKYCFTKDNELDYTVSGGGRYVHPVWNWKGDSVAATRTLCGIPITRSIFNIERKQVDRDHQVVLLTPLVKFRGVRSWLSYWAAECRELDRLKVVQGEFSRLVINTSDTMEVSTAKAGSYLCATVPASIDDAIASAALTTNKLTHSTVKSKMAPTGDFTGSEILLEYHLKGRKPGDRVDALNSVRSFQWMKTYQEFEPENPSMVSFMKPLYDGAFVPANCENNDERMVEERVRKLKNKHDEPVLSSFLHSVMSEFCLKFKETVGGDLAPVDYEVVYERQPRPSQRRILEQAEHDIRNDRASVFQKAEAYGNCNDPRAITQINGVDKRDYSAYVYALADRMKRCKWYAFGKTPRKIAERVAFLCSNSLSHIDSTDFSRMDGRVNALSRVLERMVMLKLYLPQYHLELMRLMKTQTNLKAKTKHGVMYNTGFARASGSPETSVFNTLLNAFIAFLGFRMTRINGRYMDGEEAWSSLGLYGGDDGLTPDQDGRAAEKAAKMMGQVMTVERTKRGDMGVAFLARHYGPDVWWGDANSCCDIRRQLAKFHVTTKLCSRITPVIKLQEKAFAFSLSDSETPVIGWFVNKVLEYSPMEHVQYRNVLGIWNSNVVKTSHYPNRYADWMIDLLEQQIPDFDVTRFFDWIMFASAEDLMNAPTFCEPPAPAPKPGIISVDDDIIHTETPTAPTSSDTSSNPDSDPRKKKRYRGRKPKTRRSQHASALRGAPIQDNSG